MNIRINGNPVFVDGSWIEMKWHPRRNDRLIKGLIATCIWRLWRARCDKVFNLKSMAVGIVFQQAQQNANDSARRSTVNFKEETLNSSHPYNTVFTDVSWINGDISCGLGFALVMDGNRVILAGVVDKVKESSLTVEITAALDCYRTKQLKPDRIVCDC